MGLTVREAPTCATFTALIVISRTSAAPLVPSFASAKAFHIANEAERAAPLTPVLELCNLVQYDLLASVDPQLAKHLKSEMVEPQLFMLRWTRLMFGREFHITDVFTMWDALFAHKHGVGATPSSRVPRPLTDSVAWVAVAMVRRQPGLCTRRVAVAMCGVTGRLAASGRFC